MDLTRGEASASRDSHDSREASTAAPRDEARDLWERFGQVAPPPPRTLVVISVVIVVFFITLVLMLAVTAVRESFSFVCGINFLAPILGAIRAAVDAVVASPLFKLAMCVLYAFGPEDIKASSPGNIALREELAKDGSSAESIEVTIIVMRGMCIGWGVVEIALSLVGATLLMKVCRYFIPVEY